MKSLHQREVKKIADKYARQGYKVYAYGISEYSAPPKMNGRYCDVFIQKGGKGVIIEVETLKSVATDNAQRKDLRNYASRYPNLSFKVVVAFPEKK